VLTYGADLFLPVAVAVAMAVAGALTGGLVAAHRVHSHAAERRRAAREARRVPHAG
jgi:uncharacterized membrane protein